MRAAEANVNALLIHAERNTRQGGYGVNDQQRAELVSDFAVVIQILHYAGGSFSMGEAEDLVGMAIYLLSPASDFCTGQVMYIDGGFTAG